MKVKKRVNDIEIINQTDYDLPEQSLRNFLSVLLNDLEIEKWDLPVSFVSSHKMAELNVNYRGKEGPTDVITFNAYVSGMIPDLAIISPGDIVLSLNEVKNNCKEYDVNLNEEVMRLLIHSVLHLLGWEHKGYDMKNEPMLVKQEKMVVDLIERGVSAWAF